MNMTTDKEVRRARAKSRFRNAVRQVIVNLYWLLDTEEMRIGDNVKENIALIYRKKRTEKSTLGLDVKCLLRKNTEWRTVEEMDYLYKTIGGLKCFRQWPDNVKYKMVSKTYFLYFDAGRTIVKQDAYANALYFIITGQVEVYQTYTDEVTNKQISEIVGHLGPGDMFGEVSLLKNILRTATIVTTTPCELITVYRSDFDDTLQETLKKQWDDIKAGLLSFPYFQGLSENSQTDCCMLSQIKCYDAKEIVYGIEDKMPASAYFILEGTCQVVELIYVEEKRVKDKMVEILWDPDKFSRDAKHSSYMHSPLSSKSRRLDRDSKPSVKSMANFAKENIKQEIYQKCPAVRGLLRQYGSGQIRKIIPESESSEIPILSKNVVPHFLEICQLMKSSCFFENDLLKNRRVISLTPVKILLIPYYFLRTHNKANIWDRIQTFMFDKIPNREMAFAIYTNKKKWKKYKDMIRMHVINKHWYPNDTTWFDIPFSLRMADMY